MHKNLISAVVATVVLATGASSVHAGDVGVSADASVSGRSRIMRAIDRVRSNINIRVQEKRQDTKDDNKEKRQEVKERPSASQTDRMKKWFVSSQRRLSGLIGRMSKLADRIQVKIDVAAKAGADVTAPRAALADAKVKIALASRALTDASGQVDGIIANNSAKDAFAKLHALEKGVITKIRVAHRALMNAWTQTLKVRVSASSSITPTP